MQNHGSKKKLNNSRHIYKLKKEFNKAGPSALPSPATAAFLLSRALSQSAVFLQAEKSARFFAVFRFFRVLQFSVSLRALESLRGIRLSACSALGLCQKRKAL